MTKRILEWFFGILIFLLLMKLADIALNAFVQEIALQNILAVVSAFLSLIVSAGLSEWIVRKIKETI